MTAITSISPARISPVTSGSLTIAGTDLDVVTAVTIEGRAAAIESKTATEIVVAWPKRVTNGKWDYSGGSVAVVLSAPLGSVSGAVEYLSTRDGRAVLQVNSRLAAATVENGYFYNWTAAEITSFQVDPSTWISGTWKKVVSYVESMEELQEDEVAGFRTYLARCRLDCAIPVKALNDATQEASLILSDLTRAVMLDISNGGFADTTRVTSKECFVIEGLAAGSLMVAGIGYEFKVQHVENDPTQNVSWTSSY